MDRVANLQKKAIDKLPDDELNGILPGMNSEAPPQPQDNAEPIPEPPPEPEPDVTGNVFEVDVNGVKVKMKLVPELVMKDQQQQPLPASPQPPAQGGDQMADQSLNPNADPKLLAQWMSDPATEKPYSHNDQGTVDPLEQEEEGIPVHDTGSEADLAKKKVQVHKKPARTAAPLNTGADRSNPRYPCAVCANYDVKNGLCTQGLDVEKVQAAGSCSWLNSNFKPFDGNGVMPSGLKDKETYTNDISDLPANNSGSGATKAANLKDIWKKQ